MIDLHELNKFEYERRSGTRSRIRLIPEELHNLIDDLLSEGYINEGMNYVKSVKEFAIQTSKPHVRMVEDKEVIVVTLSFSRPMQEFE